ncbi:MAG TPA: hypothetical protein VGS06_45415 [Streptosporangiaceae bacterium]|nr:hypothetical protein [Streptosporangiaceae bacterium]
MIAKTLAPETGAEPFAIMEIATWNGGNTLARGLEPRSQGPSHRETALFWNVSTGKASTPRSLYVNARGGQAAYEAETNGDRGARGEPLELLAVLARRLPPAEHLVGHERYPDHRDRDQDDSDDPDGLVGEPARQVA